MARLVPLALGFSIVLLQAAPAAAAGFAVAEQGAASLGVAGAATARTDLPEVGYFNPSAWALGTGLQSAVGGTVILPTITHQNPETGSTTDAETEPATPPYAYVGYGFGLSDRHTIGGGLSFGVPFGASPAHAALLI